MFLGTQTYTYEQNPDYVDTNKNQKLKQTKTKENSTKISQELTFIKLLPSSGKNAALLITRIGSF